MALPNDPDAVTAVKARQQIFRIYKKIASPGAIFEIDEPIAAAWIGPNSDVGEIRLQYIDSVTPPSQLVDQANVADVSVGGPFVGRLDALMNQTFGTTGTRARILAWPVDLVDPAYIQPTGPLAVPKRRFNVPPRFDLICSLSLPTSIPERRADFTHRFPSVPFQNAAGGADDGSTDIVIPIYSRRMATIQLQVPAGVAMVASVLIAALQPGTVQPFAKFIGSRSFPSVSVAVTDSLVWKASDSRNEDSIATTGTIGADAVDLVTNVGPLPLCKGMADLLIINLKPDFGGPPPGGYSLVSVYVKVSDQES